MFGCFSALRNWLLGCSASAGQRLPAGGSDESINVDNYSYVATQYGFPADHGSDENETAFNETFPDGTIVCYTDASYMSPEISTAAFAGFFGKGHPLNFASRLKEEEKEVLQDIEDKDRPTFVEIVAVKTALEKLLCVLGSSEKDIIIRVDSMHLIQGLKTAKNAKGRLKDEIKKLKNVALTFPKGVTFQHVYAHNGDRGNEMADHMAWWARIGEELKDMRDSDVDRQDKYWAKGQDLSRDKRTQGKEMPDGTKKKGSLRFIHVGPKRE